MSVLSHISSKAKKYRTDYLPKWVRGGKEEIVVGGKLISKNISSHVSKIPLWNELQEKKNVCI